MDFNITGTIEYRPSQVEIGSDIYLVYFIRHGENANKEMPLYFIGRALDKARNGNLISGDIIQVQGELNSRRVNVWVKKKYDKKHLVSQLRLIPVVKDFTFISRATVGRVIQSSYLSKLLALEEIGGKF